MAAAIVELLRSPERRRELSERALEFAHRWNSEQYAVLDRLFPPEQVRALVLAGHAQ